MKIFRVSKSGGMQAAEVPDGVLPIAYGATLDANGEDRAQIDKIDFARRVYQRRDSSAVHAFPERWIGPDDIDALAWSDTP